MTRQRGRLNLDLSHSRLVYFLAVYDQGGMNRAARELGISQQALSKSLLKLESSMGVSLFERTALGVKPTAYGERLAERARTIVSEAEMAASEIEALRGFRSGLIRLGVGPSFAARRAPAAVIELRRRTPDVGVSILVANTDILIPKLVQGELDLIISAPAKDTPSDERLIHQAFGLEYDEVVGRRDHRLRGTARPTLKQFANYPWIGEHNTSPSPCCTRSSIWRSSTPA
jgi:DNA-binding transcriptional LysR family regulator